MATKIPMETKVPMATKVLMATKVPMPTKVPMVTKVPTVPMATKWSLAVLASHEIWACFYPIFHCGLYLRAVYTAESIYMIKYMIK